MRRLCAVFALAFLLVGCREVRVKAYRQGTVGGTGAGNQIVVVRNPHDLEALGIKAPIRFGHEFGVVLLMGPHRETGWHEAIESIRANTDRIRIVAYERGPADGGEPSDAYRSYTLWIVPNSVYRTGSILDVVSPEGDAIATTSLR